MAKQKQKAEVINTENMEVLNKGDIEAFEALDTRIGVAVRGVESNMLQIFGALAVISEKNLHRVEGYKNAREYIAEKHGLNISKGQLSDAVNTFKKFGNMDTGYLNDEWLPYTFSQLKLMRKLTDEELAEVTPATSCRELQNIINNGKAIEEKTEAEETTKSGIVLTSAAKEKPQIAEVVAVGPGGMVDGNEIKMTVNVGDKVIAAKYSGTEIKIDGEEYTILRQSDILAIVE